MAGKDVIECEFVVAVDSREQLPYTFRQFKAGAAQQHKPLQISWEWGTLQQGDYSIIGHEHEITIERKSLSDLFNSCGQGRERFEREHERMAEMEKAAVVVEAEWSQIIRTPPEYTRLKPKCIVRTAMSWWIRYGVPWFTLPGRRAAEQFTFRLLEKFWNEKHRQHPTS